ncbi:MAG: heavy metal translocating P-type ATPase [Dehalococcoidia bacterium]|nr:heavy metal translocating P-type ATPase [Dehalococcoidia bacterium]
MKKDDLKINGSQQFTVEGMTCAACVRKVEKTARKVAGIQEVSVNLVTETIRFEASQLNKEELINAINKIGYKVLDPSILDQYDIEDRKMKRQNILFYKMCFALSVAFISILITLFNKNLNDFTFISVNFVSIFLLVISTIVQLWSASTLHKQTFLAAKTLSTNMNTLVSIGTFAAYTYSILIMFTNFGISNASDSLFFDTSNTIIAFVLLGHYLQERTKKATFRQVQLLSELKSNKARIIENNKEYEIPILAIEHSDIILVKPFERIPIDGIIIDGNTSTEESFLTGESIPILKSKGDAVYAGSMNVDGLIHIKITKKPNEFVIEKILQLVNEATSSKVPIQALVDKISSYFVPFVLIVAMLTFFFWMIFSSLNSFELALMNTLTVLVIACPCALGLATPIAIVASIGHAASVGILIKDAGALQKAKDATTFIFDKTGTLTTGNPIIENIYLNHKSNNQNIDEKQLIQLTASCERGSNHPFAKAILAIANEQNITLEWPQEYKTIEGLGIQATIKNHNLLIGSQSLMIQENISIDQEFFRNMKNESLNENSTIFISINQELSGVMEISDPLKKSVVKAINQLRKNGKKVILLTGDDEKITKKISEEAGHIDWIANAKPDEKMEYIKTQQSKGEIVAMIGDGANDAPALALADLSIFIPTNIESIDAITQITIINGNLELINNLIELSDKTVKIIKQNLLWAFMYNIMLLPIAAGIGYFFFSYLTNLEVPNMISPILSTDGFLNPMIAAFAMAMSSVSVIMNSLRLRSK